MWKLAKRKENKMKRYTNSFYFVFGVVAVLGSYLMIPKKDKLVALSQETLPKSTTIHVSGIAEQWVMVQDGDRFNVTKATVPVSYTGSGVFISPNNHVLTCAHLFELQEINSITVCDYFGNCTAAELLFKEDRLDLALLNTYFTTPTPCATLADPRDLKVGQEVIAIGTPLGLPFSVSHGIISALNRDDFGVYNMTQSDCFMNPGNSGGPLFNMKGELIGINSRIVCSNMFVCSFSGIGLSVQSGQILEFLTRYRGLDKAFPKWSHKND